jgi:hypothetical protein
VRPANQFMENNCGHAKTQYNCFSFSEKYESFPMEFLHSFW